MLLSLLLCALPLAASKDRPCSGELRLVAEPAKHSCTRGEPVVNRLSFTNQTPRDVYVVPYLFPFDLWVDQHSDGRWRTLSGMVWPNAKERRLRTPQRSEFRRVRPGETFTTQFDVELSNITKSVSGRYRLNSVRARVYDSDSVYDDDSSENNPGCAMFSAQSTAFAVQ